MRKDKNRIKIDEGRWYRDVKARGPLTAQCREALNISIMERLEDRKGKVAASNTDRHETRSTTTTN